MDKVLVAKSYANWTAVSNQFTKKGKPYIQMRNPETGVEKTVRVYSEAEYARMYNEKSEGLSVTHHGAMGFGNPDNDPNGDYITLLVGKNTYAWKNPLKEWGACYCRFWNWYLRSETPVPQDLPIEITPIRLYWQVCGLPNGSLIPEDKLKGIVDSLTYEEDSSEFIGEIGERITINALLDSVKQIENDYGSSTLYTFRDKDNNAYIWFTSASRDWAEGDSLTVRGTVKDHKTFRNCKQTVLSRVSEVKK